MNTHLFSILLLLFLTLSSLSARSEYNTRQAEVARQGAKVMPFALEKTLHQFTKTATGGIQKVIVRNPADQDQVLLIRQHLRQLAQKFGKGDYSGPASIHGDNMPGLAELKLARPDQLRIRYADEPVGASLTFSSDDSRVIRAVHSFFDAQLHDHGHDAMQMHDSHHQ